MGKRKRPPGLAPVATLQKADGFGDYRLSMRDRKLVHDIGHWDPRCQPVINWDRFRWFGWDVRLFRPATRNRSAVD